MSARQTFTTLEADGTVRPANSSEERAAGRRDFLRRGALAGGGAIALGTIFDTLTSSAVAGPLPGGNRSPQHDVDVLNYALTLEYLEAEFYRQAVANKAWTKPQVESFARTTAKHEAEHVAGLKAALGSSAVAKPKFDFGKAVKDPYTFLKTAMILEDTGVGAYSGQVTCIYEEDYLKYATSILTVEARHAAWARFLLGGGELKVADSRKPAPVTFDAPLSMDTVLKAVKGTGFIVG